MNAEVTAENRPDCMKPHGKHQVPSDSSGPIRTARFHTHKDYGSIQVSVALLLESLVVLFYLLLKLVVELHSGVGASPGAAQHGLQCITRSLFQSVAAGEKSCGLSSNGYLRLLIRSACLLCHPRTQTKYEDSGGGRGKCGGQRGASKIF